MLGHNLVLKSDELYLVGEISTDGSRERATGLYLRDTRHLTTFDVTLNESEPERLSVRYHGANRATVTTSNPLIRMADGTMLLPQRVMLEKQVHLDDCLRVTFVVQNFARQAAQFELRMSFAADFRDLFDIRGYMRGKRGEIQVPQIGQQEFTLAYAGLDGQVSATNVTFDHAPTLTVRSMVEPGQTGVRVQVPSMREVTWETSDETVPVVIAAFPIQLAPGERRSIAVTVEARPASGPLVAPARPAASHGATIVSDDQLFNRVLARAASDLHELQTRFPQGELPAAGIPWYVAPFGRDSLITGLQTLHLHPDRAAATLRFLAALQGGTVDPARDEEPGKILHEMRYGEMARLNEVPHTPYYGTVDATPLWLWLFAETVAWTGERTLYDQLLPHAHRALDWIIRFGDLDGDGLIDYRTDRAGSTGVAHPVWKDSFDSLNHADGTPVVGLITPVEVQGYVYAACARLADVAEIFGEEDFAAELRVRAEEVRIAVEERFWLEEQSFYAQALDGEKRPVATLSSNAGHLLPCGLPSPDRAARLITRMLEHDLNSGWGLRTLATSAASYNPMSYHNGSVWPHDNSLIGAGFYRVGDAHAGNHLLTSLFDVARAQTLERLPELTCGFARSLVDREDAPVGYPVSCSPQAWAAGALPLLVRGMLGLEPDLAQRQLRVRPNLPGWLNRVEINDLTAFSHVGRLIVMREGEGYRVEAPGLPIETAVTA